MLKTLLLFDELHYNVFHSINFYDRTHSTSNFETFI